jgi:hypothetical protein
MDMLQSISWTQFIGFIFCCVILYYGYVLLHYYGEELRAAFFHDGRSGDLGVMDGLPGSSQNWHNIIVSKDGVVTPLVVASEEQKVG